MSELLAIEAALLARARIAVPGISVADSETPLEKIPGERLPHAYVTGFAKRANEGDSGSETRILEGGIVVVSQVSLEDARALADAIEAQIVADRTLGGLVSTTFLDVEPGSSTGPPAARHYAVLAVRSLVRDGASAAAGGPLVRWFLSATVRLRAALTGGTTAAAYRTKLAADLATLLAGVRMASDLEQPPLEAVPASATRFQLVTLTSELILGSNLTGVQIFVALRVYHRGAAGESERTYTEGAMPVETATLLGRDWWQLGFSDVEIDDEELPEISFPGDVARV